VTRDLHPTVCELSFDRRVARKCHSAYTSPLPIEFAQQSTWEFGIGRREKRSRQRRGVRKRRSACESWGCV